MSASLCRQSAVCFSQTPLGRIGVLVDWLRHEVFLADHKPEHLREAALEWLRRNRIEPQLPLDWTGLSGLL